MNITDIPSQIRECVDRDPVTFGEIRARTVLTERSVRRVPARLGVAAAGLAAAGVAAALVASQTGGGTGAVLTAATLKHVASASQAAMTSGRADIEWTNGSASLTQHIAFDGANWNDESTGTGSTRPPHATSYWGGKDINRVVDGQAYHWPAVVWKPKAHFTPGWMHMTFPGAAGSLNIPDPRTLLGVLSPSAGFVSDGYTTVDGVRLQHLRATKPGGVPLGPLDPIIQSEPYHPSLSALDLWVDPSDVVVKAQFTVTGTGTKTGGASRSVNLTVTFSQIGQPQAITAPAHYISTFGPKG
jgi:hypothetical protein